jgi:ABC-2 type transport system ATP-binding protein
MTTTAIETQHLRKVFNEDKVAVADLTLKVERGEVFGFLGPNGAGKTTSVKMLLGLINPTAGTGSLLGAPIKDVPTRSRVGFLPEHFRFHDWLSAKEFLTLHADLYRMSQQEKSKRIPNLLQRVGLAPHADKKLRAFSKGMLQRIGLAQALLNHPALVFLDEPTSGLDPVGRRLVRDIIKELCQEGTTVFLNSHFLSEVEVTCDRVAFINHGEIVRTARMDSLVEGELTLKIKARNLSPAVQAELGQWSKNLRLEEPLSQKEISQIYMTIDSEADLPAINRYLVGQGVEIYSFNPQRVSLEDLFLQVVGTENGE